MLKKLLKIFYIFKQTQTKTKMQFYLISLYASVVIHFECLFFVFLIKCNLIKKPINVLQWFSIQ